MNRFRWLMLMLSVAFGALVLIGCTPASSDVGDSADSRNSADNRDVADSQDNGESGTDDQAIATPTTVEVTTTVAPSTTAPTTTTEPPRILLPPLERGANGPEVAELQEYLNEIGFSAGTVDGDYGRRTERAVTSFQMVTGLVQTGTLNEATLKALGDYTYDGLVLEAGDEGPKVEELQTLLASSALDPGTPDGEYGGRTVQAVWALEKLAGISIDGNWGPADAWAYERLLAGKLTEPVRDHEQRWVEVDLSDQLLVVYEPGTSAPVLISHISSGSGIPWANEEFSGSSITPTGDFHIQRRISGWRESSLNIGRLYNPLYFIGGIAFHGASSVPLYPDSHGCVRVPMHIAEYLPAELPNGTPVYVGA